MKPIVEQIDEFIEGLFDGSILSSLERDLDSPSTKAVITLMTSDPQFKEHLTTASKKLGELIPKYINTKDNAEKEQIAEELFRTVIVLRYTGLLHNNPDGIKELNYYKERCRMLDERNKELMQNVKDLGTQLLQLTPMKDEKVGVV